MAKIANLNLSEFEIKTQKEVKMPSIIFHEPTIPTANPRSTFEDFDGPVVVLDLDETLIKFLKTKEDRIKIADFSFEHKYKGKLCKYRFQIRPHAIELIDQLCSLVDDEIIVLAVYTASQRFYAEKIIQHLFKDKLNYITVLFCNENLGVRKCYGRKNTVLCKDLNKLALTLCVEINQIVMIDDSPQWFAQKNIRNKHVWIVPSIDINGQFNDEHNYNDPQSNDIILSVIQKSLIEWTNKQIMWKDVIQCDVNVERRLNKLKLDKVVHETDLDGNPFFIEREILLEILSQTCDLVRRKSITKKKFAWIKDEAKREETLDKSQHLLRFSSIALLDDFILSKLNSISINSGSILEDCELYATACVYLINPFIYQTSLTLDDMCKMIYKVLMIKKSEKSKKEIKRDFVKACNDLRKLTKFNIYKSESLFSCFSHLVMDVPKLSLDDKYLLETICSTCLEDSMNDILFVYASQEPKKYCKAILKAICENLPFDFVKNIEVEGDGNINGDKDMYYIEFKRLMKKHVRNFTRSTISAIKKNPNLTESPRRSSITFFENEGTDNRPVYDVIF